MKPGITHNVDSLQSDKSNWLPHWPGPADFRFDYFKLMKSAPTGIAKLPSGIHQSVAVIGAGVAGMTFAREAHRGGFEVTIFEASDRLGGRLYTLTNPLGGDQAAMELGAMRMPFFGAPDGSNSLLGYFLVYEAGLRENGALLAPFPNPGTAPGGTGIYMNGGMGPHNCYRRPTLIPWEVGHAPANDALSALSKKVYSFNTRFSAVARELYTRPTDEWTELWARIVAFYESMSFNDLVLAPRETHNVSSGNFGGLGLDADEAELLYTIGTGDGSWGAFYNIGALWFLRSTLFGFASGLQTVEGLSHPRSMPHFGSRCTDSGGMPLPSPRYEGIQSLVEYLYYCPPPGAASSLHDGAALYICEPVSEIGRDAGGIVVKHGRDRKESRFDYVVVTTTKWAAQMSIEFVGFDETLLPRAKLTAEQTQHNIASCKLFFPLRQKYWRLPSNKIPQVIVTDTFVQDAYGLEWESRPQDRGILLASYTWEDDSLKLLPYSRDELADLVSSKLRQVTMSTLDQDITQYICEDEPVMLHWMAQPTYFGCAKLYRSHNEQGNRLDLSYNQDYAARSRLYFAGENYGVEGGWTEPALRSALDALLHFFSNAGAEFHVAGFSLGADYPKWA